MYKITNIDVWILYTIQNHLVVTDFISFQRELTTVLFLFLRINWLFYF